LTAVGDAWDVVGLAELWVVPETYAVTVTVTVEGAGHASVLVALW
jgi:hypothetical protein